MRETEKESNQLRIQGVYTLLAQWTGSTVDVAVSRKTNKQKTNKS